MIEGQNFVEFIRQSSFRKSVERLPLWSDLNETIEKPEAEILECLRKQACDPLFSHRHHEVRRKKTYFKKSLRDSPKGKWRHGGPKRPWKMPAQDLGGQ